MIFFTHSKELKFILAPANRDFQGLCLKLLLQLPFPDVYLFFKGIQAVIYLLE